MAYLANMESRLAAKIREVADRLDARQERDTLSHRVAKLEEELRRR